MAPPSSIRASGPGSARARERELKTLVRAALPPDAFRRRPLRMIRGLALLAGLVGASALLLSGTLPLAAAVVVSVCLGSFYVSLMFFGHEVEHGAVLRPGRPRSAFVWGSLVIFLVPPHLWRYWHNRAHHLHTNIPGQDPDCWPVAEHERGRKGLFAWLARRMAPGSGHWLSAMSLFVAFTVQGQIVLWRESRTWQFVGFQRRRALIEFGVMVVFWFSIAASIGWQSSILVIAIPMLVANLIIMSYVHTNHMLRPMVRSRDVLGTTMSVRTLPVLDLLHLHFSHHVEHHLFPQLSHRYYPIVRSVLEEHAPDEYVAPSHWRALRVLYRTPRTYRAGVGFVSHVDGSVVSLETVERSLLGEDS